MKVRKRPVEVEAMQFTAESCADVCAWMGIEHHDVGRCGTDSPLIVHTLEGILTATPGDWIIKGVKGEFYPIKDSIFRETYEEVADAS